MHRRTHAPGRSPQLSCRRTGSASDLPLVVSEPFMARFIDPLPRRGILTQSSESTNPTARAVGAIGGNDARKACLWHGPEVLSLVADRYAPGSQVAGQR